MKERSNKLLKLCDKYAGIPLIFTLGHLRRKRSISDDILNLDNPRIVLLKTAGIGDTLLVSGVIRELRHQFPGSHITFVCTGTNRAIAEMIPEIDQVVLFNLKKPIESLKLLRQLARFDLLFDFGPWPRINSIMSYVLKSRFKVGFRRPAMHRHYIYDNIVDHSDDNHEIENYRNLLRAAGITPTGVEPALNIYVNFREKINQFFTFHKPNIIMHPFSAGSKAFLKEWPDERWAELGERLCEDGYNVMISGGKKDMPRAENIARIINRHGNSCRSIAGKLNLREMACALRESDLLISIDTGIMHLGAACGAEMVAMFGPTSPNRWGPRPLNDTLILSQTNGCQPCLSLGFENRCTTPCGCINSISVDMVYDAALRKLAAGRKPVREALVDIPEETLSREKTTVPHRQKQTVS